MPQMAPMMWMYLFYFSTLLFAMASIKLFYSTPSFLNTTQHQKTTNLKFSSQILWKW